VYTPIGVRQLRDRASHIVSAVREELTEYVITVHGEPVAILRPITTADRARLAEEATMPALAEIQALAEEVARAWTSEQSGVQIVAEQRR
jgi:prevent-host-death family protein